MDEHTFENLSHDFDLIEVDAPLTAQLRRETGRPHRHDFQEIVWIRSGSIDHLLDGERTVIPALSLLIVPRGRVHQLVPADDFTGSVLRFQEVFLPQASHLLFSQFIGQTVLALNSDEAALLEDYLTLIRSEVRSVDPYRLAPLRHLIAALIARCEEWRLQRAAVEPQDFARTLSLWNRFNSQIEQDYREQHGVAHYAASLGISPRRLGSVVRLYSGRGVAEVIDERLVAEARRLLLFSDRSVKEIAFDLGFNEHSYFTKVFRKLTGKTPSEFRAASTPST